MTLVQMCTLGLCYIVVTLVQMKIHIAHGQLTCACTTPACNTTESVTCDAVTSCYTQYLDRRDGSSPITRGCIDEKTPLLCQNRRPFVHVTPWPYLQCCEESMCNADTVITPPTWPRKAAQSTTAQVFIPDNNPCGKSKLPVHESEQYTEDEFEHPVIVIALPVVALCLFVILLIVVAVVVRQSRSHHRTGEFGANINAAGLPDRHGRGPYYSTGDPYIREKFFNSVPV